MRTLADQGLALPSIVCRFTNASEPHVEEVFATAARVGVTTLRTGSWRFRKGQRFEDVGARAGIDRLEGAFGLGVQAADFDGDSLIDLYVSNDSTANFLWKNLGNGKFEDIGLFSGTAPRCPC